MKETEFAKGIAVKAGAMLHKRFGLDNETKIKGDNDIVTKADTLSESMIFAAIRKQFPSHEMMGEEAFSGMIPEAKRLWVVDPLDATINFEAGIPFYCVSVAVVDATTPKYAPIAGAVYNPESKELYWAEAGKGAYLNNKRIFVTKRPLSESVVGFTESKDSPKMELVNKAIPKIHRLVRRFRSFGSIALETCQVAAGRYGAYFNPGGTAWDSAAANLIVKEAGGVFCDINGGAWTLRSNSVVAANTQENLRIIANSLK